MKHLRPASLVFTLIAAASMSLAAAERCEGETAERAAFFSDVYERSLLVRSSSPADGGLRITLVPTPLDGGIRENVSDKHRARYEKWKAEFISTRIGRELWEAYAENKAFVLQITVSGDRKHGAGTDDFEWDRTGRLVGATITLGADIHDGIPSPIYYPVLNSLSMYTGTDAASGRVLAAAKISHEFGHVSQIAQSSMSVLQTQSRLIPVYVSIFRQNGLNTNDRRLVEIASEMGGTPVEIWESREYWSEVSAMLYLYERIGSEPRFCSVVNRIKDNLQTYAPRYAPRFGEHHEFSTCRIGF